MTKGTGRYSEDPRFDRAANWIISITIITLIALGGWFFRSLQTSVAELKDSVTGLTKEVAVMRAERKGTTGLLARDIGELRRRVVALEAR